MIIEHNNISSYFKQYLITLIYLALLSFIFLPTVQADGEVLQGSVEENDAITRLTRPNNDSGAGQMEQGSLRLTRPSNGAPLNGLVNTDKFSSPSNSDLKNDNPSLGLVQPNKFQDLSANKFDLGADRGSRELLIGWERWYKQLSGAIYSRWSQVADIPGHAIVRITVTNNLELNAILVKSSGSAAFDSGLINAIMTLNRNPGLTFPRGSERQSVSLESDYIAGTNIEPGYNWIRNDYEKVDESY